MKHLFKEISLLLVRDIKLELKQKYALNGLFLYVFSTVYVCYLSFKSLVDVPTWNALLWIILLFTAVNATSKSFSTESKGRLLYYYTLAGAPAVILSKMIYNAALMFLISISGYLIYSLLIGDLVQDKPWFMLALLLGSTGFSSVLTLVAGIASKANNSGTLMAILSFPVLIPMLIVLIRFSKNAVDGLDHSVQMPYLFALISINIIVVALARLLYPFLWRS
ncbi:MAG: heme exporter protein CcmB [Bacteroidia bacterium]